MSSVHALTDRTHAPAAGRTQGVWLTFALLAALVAGFAVSGAFSPVLRRLLSDGERTAVRAPTNPYAPGQIVVDSNRSLPGLLRYIDAQTGIRVTASGQSAAAPGEAVLRLPSSAGVLQAAAAIRRLPGIEYAVPNYLAHTAGSWVPDDPGTAGKPYGWEKLQWNFMPTAGISAPQAWANLIADHRPGARGVVIAVLDSGVAYRNWENFKRSPDFAGTKFVLPCDLIAGTIKDGRCTDPYALDRLGHGTFVAGTLAEATNNGIGVTGLAYKASIMPVRVLNTSGAGTSSTIAEGVRYAVLHGAKVINLSLEFPPGTTASQIPDLVAAIEYAHAHGVVVVAAAGNDYTATLDYPAAAPDVISVGATTIDLCLADYSDTGRGLDLVAPGGGDDSSSMHTPNCHPSRVLPDLYQMTFPNPADPADAVDVDAFVLQPGWFGTSMAAPEVSAAAAMVIASGVLGPHPHPSAVLARLEATARHLSGATPNNAYGYGLLDIGAATANGGPYAPVGTGTTTSPTITVTTPTSTPTGTATTGARVAAS